MTEQKKPVFNSLLTLRPDDKDSKLQLVFGAYNRSGSATFWKDGKRLGTIPLGKNMYGACGQIVALIRAAIKLDPGNQLASTPVTNWDVKEGKATAEFTLVFGKDDKGIVYIGVTGNDIPKSKFPLRFPLKLDTSQVFDAKTSSIQAAESLVNFLEGQLQEAILKTEALPPPDRRGGGGGRSGGSGSSGGGSSSFTDDDMGF